MMKGLFVETWYVYVIFFITVSTGLVGYHFIYSIDADPYTLLPEEPTLSERIELLGPELSSQ